MTRVKIKFSTTLNYESHENLLIVLQPNHINFINYKGFLPIYEKFKNEISSIINSINNKYKYELKGCHKDILIKERYYPLFIDREGGVFVIPPGASRHDCSNRPHVLARFLKQKNFFLKRFSTAANQPSPPSSNFNTPSSSSSRHNGFHEGDETDVVEGQNYHQNHHETNTSSSLQSSETIVESNGDKNELKLGKEYCETEGDDGIYMLRLVIFCEYRHIVSYATAIARGFPAFNAKSSKASKTNNSKGKYNNPWVQGIMPTLTSESATNGGNVKTGVGKEKEVCVTFCVLNPVNDPTNKSESDKNNHNLLEGTMTEKNYRFISEQDANMLNQLTCGVRLASILVDMPCNLLSTNEFIQEIQRVGSELGIVPKIIRGNELELKGFGGIYGVGKAAVNPPALVVLSHEPENSNFNIAWVGKGIVYDTGGLSMKSKTAMLGMKRDCGGAAAILAAFYSCIKLGFEHKLHAIFCLAENAVGPNATRPDDIHTLYSGKTVEINNTDAEGRLVLADGVAYASNDLNCDIILDMATLTGAQGIATGKFHAALVTNDGLWENYCYRAGKVSGDLVYPLPYCPELHFSEFNSVLADMKNSVSDRSNAQSSCAGLFIASHLKNGFNFPGVWLHVDMAAPVDVAERATGYGVGLLLTLFGFGSHDCYLKDHCPIPEDILLKQYYYFQTLHQPKTDKFGERFRTIKADVRNIDNISNIGRDNPFGIVGAMMKKAACNKPNQDSNQASQNNQDKGRPSPPSIKKSILPPNARLSKRSVQHRASEPVLEGGY